MFQENPEKKSMECTTGNSDAAEHPRQTEELNKEITENTQYDDKQVLNSSKEVPNVTQIHENEEDTPKDGVDNYGNKYEQSTIAKD